MKQVLIGGCGSSGTTLFRKMLNAHKDIVCGPEMSVFDRPMMYSESIDYLYTLWRFQDFDPLDKGCIYPLRITNRYTGDQSYCGLIHENHLKFYHTPAEVDSMFDKTSNIQEFLGMFFDQYAEKNDAGIWAEKTPNNIFCADRWLKAFPEGKFIHVLRDGRDAILSMNWRRKIPIYIGTYRWLSAVNKFIEMGLLNDRVLTLRYEKLVTDAEVELERVCQFLGIEFDGDMLDYWKKDIEETDGDLKYGTQPVFTNSIGKWRNEDYDRTILDQIMIAITPQMEIMGYEIE